MSCSSDDDLPDISPDLKLYVGEGPVTVEIDFFKDCAEFWTANEDVSSGDQIRPSPANGYALQCIQSGTTGRKEPPWPAQLDAEMPDGSAKWKVIAAGTNGINTLSNPSAEVSPITGLSVGTFAVVETRKVTARFTPTVAGDYTVTHSFTVRGEVRKAKQNVTVV